jgi:hypothetical protein
VLRAYGVLGFRSRKQSSIEVGLIAHLIRPAAWT